MRNWKKQRSVPDSGRKISDCGRLKSGAVKCPEKEVEAKTDNKKTHRREKAVTIWWLRLFRASSMALMMI